MFNVRLTRLLHSFIACAFLSLRAYQLGATTLGITRPNPPAWTAPTSLSPSLIFTRSLYYSKEVRQFVIISRRPLLCYYRVYTSHALRGSNR